MFPKADQFRAGCAICILLTDRLLSECQRIAGWYILCELFRSDTHSTNPFLPVFVDNFRHRSSVIEKLLLTHLLSATAPNKDVRELTPACVDCRQKEVHQRHPGLQRDRERVTVTVVGCILSYPAP